MRLKEICWKRHDLHAQHLLRGGEDLFRVERAEPDPDHREKLRLDAYSRASRLSFFLWDSTPDAELMAAAQSGAIESPDGLQQQVERLLSSPRVEDGLRAFIADMFGAAKRGGEAGHDLKRGYDDTYAILAPKYGDWVIFEHCIPFNLSRAFDEAGGTRDPRIWTAERDMEMWRALQA